MRHKADCLIAACAMAANASYEDAENVIDSGAEYSAKLMNQAKLRRDNPDDEETRNANRARKMFLLFRQQHFFTDRGLYPLLIPGLNPPLKRGRRYLLSASSRDPADEWMGHVIVLDEAGKVFDPNPKFEEGNPQYAIQNYADLLGWEIVRWKRT